MNFQGGCCIVRYGGGGGGGGEDMSKVDRIMLRYRPIAPRPDSGGSTSPPVNVSSKSRRGKRKYSKDQTISSSGGSDISNGNSTHCEENKKRSEIMTLSLLPEAPYEKKKSLSPSLCLELGDDRWYKMETKKNLDVTSENVGSSLLTVECVTERWMEEREYYEIGCTDEEKKMSLERDTCPCFISDGLGRVIWTNGSYKKMLFGKEDDQCNKLRVLLVMKERFLLTQRTFTCRMRMQYTCRDKEVNSITSFCDVWRMNNGGFAWRLDVHSALCLGR